MFGRICICCGEAMIPVVNGLSRNPHLCSSCSSLADGLGPRVEPGIALNFDEETSAPAGLPKITITVELMEEPAPTTLSFSF
jgi:hypothetical protein